MSNFDSIRRKNDNTQIVSELNNLILSIDPNAETLEEKTFSDNTDVVKAISLLGLLLGNLQSGGLTEQEVLDLINSLNLGVTASEGLSKIVQNIELGGDINKDVILDFISTNQLTINSENIILGQKMPNFSFISCDKNFILLRKEKNKIFVTQSEIELISGDNEDASRLQLTEDMLYLSCQGYKVHMYEQGNLNEGFYIEAINGKGAKYSDGGGDNINFETDLDSIPPVSKIKDYISNLNLSINTYQLIRAFRVSGTTINVPVSSSSNKLIQGSLSYANNPIDAFSISDFTLLSTEQIKVLNYLSNTSNFISISFEIEIYGSITGGKYMFQLIEVDKTTKSETAIRTSYRWTASNYSANGTTLDVRFDFLASNNNKVYYVKLTNLSYNPLDYSTVWVNFLKQ